MWVHRFFAFAVALSAFVACGGKSIRTIGGEAGAGSTCELTECGEDCVDTSSDERNCGDCGRRCASDESCVSGECQSTRCDPPAVRCGSECVDTLFSNEHCGGCGFACGFGAVCSNGFCIAVCPGGQCGGVCVDFATDPNNCGGCGVSCGFSAICNGGLCQPACAGGSLCGGQCVDLRFDPFNCGGCGNVCSRDEGLVCNEGVCASVCPAGSLFCSGVCVDPLIDPGHCGRCGNVCPPDTRCQAGGCAELCPGGALCDGRCVDLRSDPSHCGGCGIACPMGQSCAGGTCGTCGNGVLEAGEEGDPPPGPLMAVPLLSNSCRYDFSRITQWYCNGSCGHWGDLDEGCDAADADAFCKLRMDNPRSTATSFSVATAQPAPGVCCPSEPAESLGCTSLGILSSRGVMVNVSVHPSDLVSTHFQGRVITDLVCSDP